MNRYDQNIENNKKRTKTEYKAHFSLQNVHLSEQKINERTEIWFVM